MNHYAVDVTVSDHDALKQGILARPVIPGGPTWYRIIVSATEARNDVDAMLIAAQMASCHGMCTSAELVSWPVQLDQRPDQQA
jgi:hypothetical protein